MINNMTTPSSKNNLVGKIRKNLKWHQIIFIASIIFFPVLSYSSFEFNWMESSPEFSSDIEAPVAKLITDGKVGTAFLVNSTTLLTARHVVMDKKPGDQVELVFEKSESQYRTTGTIKYIAETSIQIADQKVPFEYFLNDVAVIETSEINDIIPLNIGSSIDVKNLDEVIVIGYPQGDYSITKGNINSDKYQGYNLFKIDATANPGNSGGPCISKKDNSVIGILVGGSGAFVQGENVALKIDDVVKLLAKSGIRL